MAHAHATAPEALRRQRKRSQTAPRLRPGVATLRRAYARTWQPWSERCYTGGLSAAWPAVVFPAEDSHHRWCWLRQSTTVSRRTLSDQPHTAATSRLSTRFSGKPQRVRWHEDEQRAAKLVLSVALCGTRPGTCCILSDVSRTTVYKRASLRMAGSVIERTGRMRSWSRPQLPVVPRRLHPKSMTATSV